MKRKIKKAIAVCLLLTSVIVPITALTVPGDSAEYPTSCNGCGYSNTGRLVYSAPIRWGGHDDNYHWDTENVYFRCTNTEVKCPYYSTDPHFMTMYKNREVIGTKEPHQTSPNPGQTPSSVTYKFRIKGSVHDRIQVKHYHCCCGKPFTTSQTVEVNKRHFCAKHTTKNGVTTHTCVCGASKKGKAHFN